MVHLITEQQEKYTSDVKTSDFIELLITIFTETGMVDRSFSLINMDPNIMISDIKFLTYLFYKIPQVSQTLTFDSIVMENDKTLGYYGVIHSSMICLKIIN